MFKITSNAYANTGDGPAVCARRGIPLEDMEFFQFHPTGIKGLGILISEAVRGEGGILRNRDGERFMEHYSPTLLDLGATGHRLPGHYDGDPGRQGDPRRP